MFKCSSWQGARSNSRKCYRDFFERLCVARRDGGRVNARMKTNETSLRKSRSTAFLSRMCCTGCLITTSTTYSSFLFICGFLRQSRLYTNDKSRESSVVFLKHDVTLGQVHRSCIICDLRVFTVVQFTSIAC